MFMRKSAWWGFILIVILLLGGFSLTHAQTETPPPTNTPIPTDAPLPTEPPAILVIQPTPVPAPPPQGSPWQQFWQTYQTEIITVLIGAIVGGILVGIFLNRIAGQIADWLGRFWHFLFDHIASVPIVRLRYEKEYRATLAAKVQDLQSGNLIDRQIKLNQMYVPALLTEETRPDVADFADRYRTRAEMRQQQRKRSVPPWEAVERYHRFVVLGGPGAGKTTYLYHLAYMCATREKLPDYLPLFIRFRELVADLPDIERLEDIFPHVFAELKFPNAENYIKQMLKKGRFLILLDGLDEVPNETDHQKLVQLVQNFADRYVRPPTNENKGNILIVSSREFSYEHGQQLAGFTKTAVMEFEDPTIERFIHNWFGHEKNVWAGDLISELKENQRFLELARNPLLLLLITYQFERDRKLPPQRAGLYKRCIYTRLEDWNQKRGTHSGRFGEKQKNDMLGELALHIFEHEEKGLLYKNELLMWLGDFVQKQRLPEGATAEELLTEIAKTSGLLQEWAIDRYGFSHQTLQEYFAADALWQMGPEEGANRLGQHLSNPAWKEVILLYSGLSKDAKPLLTRLIGQAKQPGADKNLWLLAAQALAEGAQQTPEPLRQDVADKLIALLRGAEGGLTITESSHAAVYLKEFAPDLLPEKIQPLLQSGEPDDLLLAEQLLPKGVDSSLRRQMSQRLAALTRDADAETQQAAVAALGRLGGDDAASANALLSGLTDDDLAVRVEACRALSRQKTVDDETAAALHRLYTADADEARHAALQTLLAVGRAAEVGMAAIPAGEFLMGRRAKEPGAKENEQPQHTVYLPAYFMDITPVTNAQYRRFMEAGGYAHAAYWPEAIAAKRWQDGQYIDYDNKKYVEPRYWQDKTWNGDEQPVVGVSWYEALAYARWAGKRLPTEAEWEKAARGADGRLYPWGPEWAADKANTKEAKLEKTTPVGHYSPQGDSPYGLADMSGNVWEWCSTRWGFAYPYTPDDGREELSGGDDIVRLLRGGSWYNENESARCGVRLWRDPWRRYHSWGFRCCCATSSLTGSEF